MQDTLPHSEAALAKGHREALGPVACKGVGRPGSTLVMHAASAEGCTTAIIDKVETPWRVDGLNAPASSNVAGTRS